MSISGERLGRCGFLRLLSLRICGCLGQMAINGAELSLLRFLFGLLDPNLVVMIPTVSVAYVSK